MVERIKPLVADLEALSRDIKAGKKLVSTEFADYVAAAFLFQYDLDLTDDDHVLMVLCLVWMHLFYPVDPGRPRSYPISDAELLLIVNGHVKKKAEVRPSEIAKLMNKNDKRLSKKSQKSILQQIKRVIENAKPERLDKGSRVKFEPIILRLQSWLQHHVSKRQRRGKHA